MVLLRLLAANASLNVSIEGMQRDPYPGPSTTAKVKLRGMRYGL